MILSRPMHARRIPVHSISLHISPNPSRPIISLSSLTRFSQTPCLHPPCPPNSRRSSLVSLRLYSTQNPKKQFPEFAKLQHQVHKEAAAKAAAGKSGNGSSPPPTVRLLIYHAGTGRVAFLAALKLTSVFLCAFFLLVATPANIKTDQPTYKTIGVILSGFLVLILIHAPTSSFVTHIHMHLPPHAALNSQSINRFFAATQPPLRTPLTITTMNLIGKPRYSHMLLGDLQHLTPRQPPASSTVTKGTIGGGIKQRLGMVNWARDTTAENSGRSWYNHRAVGSFFVEEEIGNRWLWRPVSLWLKGR